MAAFTTIAIGLGAAAATYGTYTSMKAQKKASRAQEQQQEVQSRKSRRQAIRQAQVARAQAVASASSVGATGSSAAMGGLSSLSSQVGTEMGYSTQMSGLSRDISRYSRKAADASAIASIGGSLFQAGGGWDGLSNLFPSQRPKQAAIPDLTVGYS